MIFLSPFREGEGGGFPHPPAFSDEPLAFPAPLGDSRKVEGGEHLLVAAARFLWLHSQRSILGWVFCSWSLLWENSSRAIPADPKERDPQGVCGAWSLYGSCVVSLTHLFFPLSLPAGPSRTGCNERSVPALPWKAVTRPSSPGRTMGAASLSTSNGLISTAPTSRTRPAAWSSPRRRAADPWTA